MTTQRVFDAVVVGSGPNGLAAAITLCRARRSVLLIEAKATVGGGLRSADLTLPGFHHDVCSAVHPMGVASPFFKSINLSSLGVEWTYSPAPLAHPLDDGSAVVLEHSIETTADKLGHDRNNYLKRIRHLVVYWDTLVKDLLQPLHFPQNPILFARFSLQANQSISHFVNTNFKTEQARALITGLSAHSIMPMWQRGGAAVGLVFAAAGHAVGWPIVKGGSQKLADILQDYFIKLGGEIMTGTEVESLDALPSSRSVFLDITPRQLAKIAKDRFSQKYNDMLTSYSYGPGIFKVDWALNGPIPWKAVNCLQAATVHVGGTYEEIAESENSIWKDKIPDKPFTILGQPSLFDNSLAPEGKHSAWAYCRVPNGSNFNMTEKIENQIERFAPGFRNRIIFRHTMNTKDLEAYNPNNIGGDIGGGRQNPIRNLVRPVGQWRPYALPLRGIYLCSSSMPPGPGVHGMCGYYAAQKALSDGIFT
jgi:phytoene dehydrogenase-like protein